MEIELRICKTCMQWKDPEKDFYKSVRNHCRACTSKKNGNQSRLKRVSMVEDEYTYFNQKVKAKIASAKTKGMDVNITVDYVYNLFLEQGKVCALSGKPFNEGNPYTNMSIDRIDSGKGYVEGNVRLIWNFLNVGKGSMNDQLHEYYLLVAAENIKKKWEEEGKVFTENPCISELESVSFTKKKYKSKYNREMV